jgi:hypothetical protein
MLWRPKDSRALLSITLASLSSSCICSSSTLLSRALLFGSYDSSGAFIEPHVDNHSVITGIVMLSGIRDLCLHCYCGLGFFLYEVWVLLSHFAAIVLPERDVEFEGGINCFEPNRQYVPPLPPLFTPRCRHSIPRQRLAHAAVMKCGTRVYTRSLL